MSRTVAEACANIALVKYWGKRDAGLNLPAVSSLSITLEQLRTRTVLQLDPALDSDQCTLDGVSNAETTARISRCLDAFRQTAGKRQYARVESRNNFPTAAGMASSASGFAALAVAADAALDCGLDRVEVASLARRSSGSAGRSVFGGFAEQSAGRMDDGSDCTTRQLAPADHWPLEVVIAVTSEESKSVGSTDGMTRSARTSPFYKAWVDGADYDLDEARTSVLDRDFEKLAAVSEFSCLKMHALILSSRPGILYWNSATMECMHRVRRLRDQGTAVFFSIDAGPQLKAVCLPGAAAVVTETLGAVPGVQRTIHSALGRGARVVPA